MCLAVPGKLIDISVQDAQSLDAEFDPALQRRGRVSFGGVMKEVSLAYVPEAQIGDYVLVHVGFALSVIDPAEAERTLRDIQMIQTLGAS